MANITGGGIKAAKTNKLRHGEDFYKRIGALGGAKGRTGGFFANRELASKAGRVGGRKSSRAGTPNRTKVVGDQVDIRVEK